MKKVIVNLSMPLGEELLNDKEALTNVANGLFSQMGTVKDVTVERIYVFGTGKEGAILCFRKEDDDEEFYRGGMCFYRSDLDTAEKTYKYFIDNKDVLNSISSKWINRRKPLLLKTSNVEVLLEKN